MIFFLNAREIHEKSQFLIDFFNVSNIYAQDNDDDDADLHLYSIKIDIFCVHRDNARRPPPRAGSYGY
jgi:hypothetical protein